MIINRKKMVVVGLMAFFMGGTVTVYAQIPQPPQQPQQPMQTPRPQPQQPLNQPQQQTPQFPQQQPEQGLQKQQLPNFNQQQGNTKISDKELKEFASVYPEVRDESQKAQQKMAAVIEKDGMQLKRFNELQTATLRNKKIDADKKELKTFKTIKKELDKMQPQIQKKIQSLIKSSGLTVARYQTIASAIQTDPDLKSRFQKIMSDNGGTA